MASPQIRNMGTIGGNLCNASPAADTAPPLLVLEANAEISSIHHVKTVSIQEFFLGPGKPVISSDELLTKIKIPAQTADQRWAFVKLGRRNAYTLSIINIAAIVEIDDNSFENAKIALGAVAPTPLRIHKAEEFLK